MGVYTLMQKIGSVYYFRQAVPNDLKIIIGRNEIKESLKTKDYKLAISRNKAKAIETEARFKALRNGEPVKTITISNQPIVSDNSVISIIPNYNSTTKGNGKTLRDICEKWIEQKAKDLKAEQGIELSVKDFEQVHGNILVGAITTGHLVEFRDWLLKQASASATKNKRIAQIKSLVSFAHNNDLIKTNPLLGFNLKIAKNDSKPYISFEKKELEALLLNDNFGNLRRSNPEYYWIILIGLFTGARVEEICQLLVSDVKEKQDIHYFDINEYEEGKSLKTQSSKRLVPIHNELIRMGLLEYVHNMGKTPKSLLFPNLKLYDGRHSIYFSKWFGRFKKAQGIESGMKVFHSFRHTFKEAIRNCGVHTDIHHRLTGHSSSNVGDRYGGISISKLNEELQKFVIPIDLSSYYIKTNYALNPALYNATQQIAVISPASKPKSVLVKEQMQALSLAEAYNRIASKHFGDRWIHYEIVVGNNKHALLSCMKRGHNQQPIMPPISSSKLIDTDRGKASKQEIDKHQMIEFYLNKAIYSPDGVTCYYKLEGKNTWYVLDKEIKENIIDYPEGLPLSKRLLKEPVTSETKLVDLLINPESLTKFIDGNIYGR